MAAGESDPKRKAELLKIADVCRWVPANAPRDFWEAVQMYWFVHLGTITELNGWDAMSPGHLDQHLAPFYEKGVKAGTLDRDAAKELLSCLWIKVNNTRTSQGRCNCSRKRNLQRLYQYKPGRT